MLLALPSSDSKLMDTHQTSSLQTGFIDYLRDKGAAGIINVPKPGEHEVRICDLQVQPIAISAMFPSSISLYSQRMLSMSSTHVNSQ